MDVVSFSSGFFLEALAKAELILTLNIVAGLVIGELIIGFGLVERLFSPVIPRVESCGIHGKIAAAMLIALASPRSGATVISRAYSDSEITREEATYGTLSLAFPGYLRRWVGTAAMAVSMAGKAGLVFALAIVARSACRFVWVVALLSKRGVSRLSECRGTAIKSPTIGAKERAFRVLATLRRSLPWAWGFFALTYALVPFVDRAFSEYVARRGIYDFLPAEGWAVAVSSMAHVTAGMSSAAGALESGSIGTGQAVLALLVGNMAGSVTRTMRQNVGYWSGIFPKDLLPGLVRWHLATTIALEALSILIAWCLLEVG